MWSKQKRGLHAHLSLLVQQKKGERWRELLCYSCYSHGTCDGQPSRWLPMTLTLILTYLYQSWCVWPIAWGRSDSMSLCSRLKKPTQLLSWVLHPLPTLINSLGKGLLQAAKKGHVEVTEISYQQYSECSWKKNPLDSSNLTWLQPQLSPGLLPHERPKLEPPS